MMFESCTHMRIEELNFATAKDANSERIFIEKFPPIARVKFLGQTNV